MQSRMFRCKEDQIFCSSRTGIIGKQKAGGREGSNQLPISPYCPHVSHTDHLVHAAHSNHESVSVNVSRQGRRDFFAPCTRPVGPFLAICVCIFSSQGHEHAVVLSISASVTDNYFRFAGQKQERVLLPVASTRIPSQTCKLHLVRTHSDFCLHCYHKLSTCCGALTRQQRHRCTQILPCLVSSQYPMADLL